VSSESVLLYATHNIILMATVMKTQMLTLGYVAFFEPTPL